MNKYLNNIPPKPHKWESWVVKILVTIVILSFIYCSFIFVQSPSIRIMLIWGGMLTILVIIKTIVDKRQQSWNDYLNWLKWQEMEKSRKSLIEP